MAASALDLVLVSTPIGHLGSGRGGGVELTIASLLRGLQQRGHHLHLVAPERSRLPEGCGEVALHRVEGIDQPSWQHAAADAPVLIPSQGVLPRLWELALELGDTADAVINFSYDWLPFWLTPRHTKPIFHLVSMGSVAPVMDAVLADLARWNQSRLAFHTHRQAADFRLPDSPVVVGNGFDLNQYQLQLQGDGPLGWAGRVAPEKGLEDAVAVAIELGEPLLVWGVVEDPDYAARVETAAPAGTIEWRGFLPTAALQRDLGRCRGLINTPKWNEAYGNVVVEALACGVPVIAYDRGGPGEIIQDGVTGWLVRPDNREALVEATRRLGAIDRHACRRWVEAHASQAGFAERVERWICQSLAARDGSISPCP